MLCADGEVYEQVTGQCVNHSLSDTITVYYNGFATGLNNTDALRAYYQLDKDGNKVYYDLVLPGYHDLKGNTLPGSHIWPSWCLGDKCYYFRDKKNDVSTFIPDNKIDTTKPLYLSYTNTWYNCLSLSYAVWSGSYCYCWSGPSTSACVTVTDDCSTPNFYTCKSDSRGYTAPSCVTKATRESAGDIKSDTKVPCDVLYRKKNSDDTCATNDIEITCGSDIYCVAKGGADTLKKALKASSCS